MSFQARVFRVLIASPSDVIDEREIAVAAIQAWNDINSAERQLVLLPLRWETHAAPEFGKRPQEVINRQVVDKCDLLIGIFWTRIGSPTGEADSGTIEEIERVAKAGKPIMLYFSEAKQDPSEIDLTQLGRLRQFKLNTFPKALIERYHSQVEFRDKLSKQLEIQLRSIIANEGSEVEISDSLPKTEIQFEFSDPGDGRRLGNSIALEGTVVEANEISKVPDFESSHLVNPDKDSLIYIPGSTENREFYRDTVKYIINQNLFRPIRFWMKNTGSIGARDVYVDISIQSKSSVILLLPPNSPELSSPSRSRGLGLLGFGTIGPADTHLDRIGDQWRTSFELRALQPQREISPAVLFFVGAEEDGVISIEARIFADSLPSPTVKTIVINWTARKVSRDALALLRGAGISLTPGPTLSSE